MCKCTPAGHEVHPQPEQESIFRSFFWVVKKCTPADKILATPMSVRTSENKERKRDLFVPCCDVDTDNISVWRCGQPGHTIRDRRMDRQTESL